MVNLVERKQQYMNDLREIESILEAVLFTAGDSVSLEKLSEIVDQDRKTTASILSNLEMKYRNSHRGIMLRQLGTSYQLCTKPEYEQYIAALGTSRKKRDCRRLPMKCWRLLPASTVTRAQVEQIRGVNSDSVIINLMEKPD